MEGKMKMDRIENQGIRNNYVRALIELPELKAGDHKLFIRAIDPGVVIDKISFLTSEKKL